MSYTGHDSFNVHSNKVVYDSRLYFMIFMTVRTNHRISRFCGVVFDTFQNRRIIMSHDIRHYDTYNAGGFPTKTLGERIWTVIHFFSQHLYTFLHILTYFWTLSKSSRNGSNTHP